jgi:hypothetical protein
MDSRRVLDCGQIIKEPHGYINGPNLHYIWALAIFYGDGVQFHLCTNIDFTDDLN